MNQNLYFQRGIQIITKLNEITPQAYLVGGVVRDYLLKIPFNDIDIATSATPEQVLALFPNAIQEFADYGCITIKEGDMIFEITTFREEVYAKQSRKPSEIHYSKKLQDDINRRDFTINALAMPKSLVLVDLVNGERDLKNKVIRSIGSSKVRFKEDPLRILRGLSLMAKLGFSIERNTLNGMIKCRKHLTEIANVKMTAELANIFSQPYGKKAIKLMVKKQLFKYVNNYHRWLKIVSRKYDKLSIIEKFIILYKMEHLVSDNSCFNKETIAKIKEIIEISNVLESHPVTEYEVYKYQLNDLISADLINSIMLKKYSLQTKTIDSFAKNRIIEKRSDIVINPQTIIDLADGKTGSFVNDIMIQIEKDITTQKIKNSLDELVERIKELLKIYGVINQEVVVKQTEPSVKEDTRPVIKSEEKIVIPQPELIVNQKDDIQLDEIEELLNTIKPSMNDLSTIEAEEKPTQPSDLKSNVQEMVTSEEPTFEIKVDSESAPNEEADLSELLKEYQHEYKLMLDRKMLATIDDSMTLKEINEIKENLEPTVRLLTVKANPKFEILLEKGLI